MLFCDFLNDRKGKRLDKKIIHTEACNITANKKFRNTHSARFYDFLQTEKNENYASVRISHRLINKLTLVLFAVNIFKRNGPGIIKIIVATP